MTGIDENPNNFNRDNQLLAQTSTLYHDQNISTKRRRRKINDKKYKKRKTDMEFSENPYTKKNKSRIKTITKTEKTIERTKNSDR
jgi:hypothetical protein